MNSRSKVRKPKLWSMTTGVLLLTLAVSCREESSELSQGSDEQFIGPFKKFVEDFSFCNSMNKVKQCKEAEQIAFDANALAAAAHYFGSDPCGTDGQRDVFRHVYTMVWITGLYGRDFAESLHNHKDPDPKKSRETNPQILCQRNMDRKNNLIGMNVSSKIFSICKIPANPSNPWNAYKTFLGQVDAQARRQGRHDRDTNCVAYNVFEIIRFNSSTFPFSSDNGPVVIQRDPKNAAKCWLARSSENPDKRGRSHCNYSF